MTNIPTFSIIVPIYKVEDYLERCVRSIVCQTYSNIEIILVDDGSPDSCPIMCDRYADTDQRIKVVHKKNGGLSDARNKGVKAAIGKYIMFVDSDDFINETACELLLPYVLKDPDVIVTDGIVIGDTTTNLLHYSVEKGIIYQGKAYVKECVSKGNLPMAAWLNVFSRDYLIREQLTFKTGILHEDEQFTPRALLSAKSIIYTGEAYYNYIIRDNSITTKKDKRKNARDFYSTCIELSALYERLDDTQLKEKLLDLLVCKYLSLFQSAKLYQYGKNYIHKSFVLCNAYTAKTKLKAILFIISPMIYWHINNGIKAMRGGKQ